MHLNSCTLIGRVGKHLPKLDYPSSGNPTCRFTLEVDELTKSGEVFTLFLPIELWGQAELAVETLEPGDEVMLTGRLKYTSVVDPKTQVKPSKLIISSWGVSQRIPASSGSTGEAPQISGEYDSTSVEAIVDCEPNGAAPATKARRPRRLTQGPRYVGVKSALQN